MKKELKKIALSSIFSALTVVLLLFGTFLEVFDITVAAICSLVTFIVQLEAKNKYAFLVFLSSSVLALIFSPLSSATLYYIGFFGYYPLIRGLFTKCKKITRKLICFSVFNVSMVLIMLLFKVVFALQNEPPAIYIALLVTLNIFFLCLDRIFDVFPILYVKFIRNKIRFISK